MDEDRIRRLIALPEKKDGFLGPYWVYDGRKYESEAEALAVRRKRLREAGLTDPFPERATPRDETAAADSPPPANPGG